ncbi:MAG: Crp/Fnr family transcriptional regulator [Anaerolineae bacterium]|nr:Crp/Fnr family transcriptional regulator [Anaerolineae bacterium]
MATDDLRQIGLLAQVSERALRRLARVTTTQTYEDGRLILLEGDIGAPVLFVRAGSVRVYRASLGGREQNLIHLHAGDALNLPAAFAEPGAAPASAMAVGEVTVLRIPRADFRRIASETPEIALAVLGDLAGKLYHFTELSHDLGLRTVRGRLARFLLTHAQAEDDVLVRWTHQEIASQIGTVREVVSRTLHTFRKEGLIEMRRQQVVVSDPEAMAREAEV